MISASLLVTGLLLTGAPPAAAPAAAAPNAQDGLQAKAPAAGDESVRELLKRLVPDGADPSAPTAAESVRAQPAAPVAAPPQVNAMQATFAPSGPESRSTAVLLAFGLIAAFGLATMVSRKKALGARPLRRLAAESIGARQQIVLVEALGEYLLVATGGKEPVLLAQLDTAQARQRLEAMQQSAADETAGADGALSSLLAGFRRKKPSFDEALGEATRAAAVAAPAAEPSAADLARTQAALRSYAQEAVTPPAIDAAALRDATLGQIAAARRLAAPVRGPERADEIRRRLAAL